MDEEFELRLMYLVKEHIVALVGTIELQSVQQPSVLYVNSRSKDSSTENVQIKCNISMTDFICITKVTKKQAILILTFICRKTIKINYGYKYLELHLMSFYSCYSIRDKHVMNQFDFVKNICGCGSFNDYS